MMAISKKNTDLMNQTTKTEDKPELLSDHPKRVDWIKESAYFMAESRGFAPGYEQQDWNMAEREYAHCVAIE